MLPLMLEPMFKTLHVVSSLIGCRNPSLGLATKVRVCKRLGQERDPGVWESVKMNFHTPKWTPMLGVGVPMDFRNFKERL
jgi:hypothetical protein